LVDDFDEHGRSAIAACREQTPARYLAIVASLLPKRLEIAQDSPVTEMTLEGLEAHICMGQRIKDLERAQFEKDEYAAQAAQDVMTNCALPPRTAIAMRGFVGIDGRCMCPHGELICCSTEQNLYLTN
jgi:hypothetical protein